MTLQLMMMHHNSKFGNKMFGGLDDIIWININILTLCCDLDRKRRNPILSQDNHAYDAVLANLVWLQTDQQFRRYRTNSHILIIEVKEPVYFFKALWYMMLHKHTKFDNKIFCGSDDIIRTNSH